MFNCFNLKSYGRVFIAMIFFTLPLTIFAAANLDENIRAQVSTSDFLEKARSKRQLDRIEAKGGEVDITWNEAMLLELGLNRGSNAKRSGVKQRRERVNFSEDTRLSVDMNWRSVIGMSGGKGVLLTPYKMRTPIGLVDMRKLNVQVQAGEYPRIQLFDAGGRELFYVDKIMFELLHEENTFAISTADLHVGEGFAKLLGKPQVYGMPIGRWKSHSPVLSRAKASQPLACGDPNWPGEAVVGVPGEFYRADVFMTTFTGTLSRCGTCDVTESNCTVVSCSSPSATHAVYTPSSTLANNRNRGSSVATVASDPLGTSAALYAADVTWNTKFNGNFAPYNNDQHPYLIWNLYRLDVENGVERMTQIGRSGMKHAWLTTNTSPFGGSDPCESCNGNHILGKSCGDTYGVTNNDETSDLGKRNEIIPATGEWGRSGFVGGTSDFDYRMRVPVASLIPSSTNVRYLFESWYIVREDINIYNTMASRSVTIGANNAISNAGSQPFRLGPVIDRWVDPASVSVLERNRELSSTEGHAKVAVKVNDLGGGLYRYHFAVMNLDFTRATLSGVVPNQTVSNNFGFNRFRIPMQTGTSISNVSYTDGDPLRADWSLNSGTDFLEWTAPNNDASLNWGGMTTISFTADRAPSIDVFTLGVTNAGSPTEFNVESLRIGADVVLPELLIDGFED